MRRVGADQPRLARGPSRREVAAHVAGRHAVAAQARQSEVGEVLADARPLLDHIRDRGSDRGRGLVVVEVGLDPVHQVGHGFADRTPRGEGCRGIRPGGIHVQRLGRLHRELGRRPRSARDAGVQDRTRALPGLEQGVGVVLGGNDRHIAERVDREAHVRLRHMEVRHDVAVAVGVVGDVARERVDRDRPGRHVLPRQLARPAVREAEAARDVVVVRVGRGVRDAVSHCDTPVTSVSESDEIGCGTGPAAKCRCTIASPRRCSCACVSPRNSSSCGR